MVRVKQLNKNIQIKYIIINWTNTELTSVVCLQWYGTWVETLLDAKPL